MNFKGQKIHDTFQSPLYDVLYTKLEDEVWGTVWGRVEDQVCVGTDKSNIDFIFYYKLLEYEFSN